MSKKVVTTYIHGSEEDFVDDMPTEWFPNRDAERNALNWAYELKLEVEIDTETGDSNILSIDDKPVGSKLEEFVKSFAYEHKVASAEDIWQGTITEEDAQEFLEKCLKLSGAINGNE